MFQGMDDASLRALCLDAMVSNVGTRDEIMARLANSI